MSQLPDITMVEEHGSSDSPTNSRVGTVHFLGAEVCKTVHYLSAEVYCVETCSFSECRGVRDSLIRPTE